MMASRNDPFTEEYRANAGVLGGYRTGRKTLLLHVPGRKTGKITTPRT
jgi:hypothetical protein